MKQFDIIVVWGFSNFWLKAQEGRKSKKKKSRYCFGCNEGGELSQLFSRHGGQRSRGAEYDPDAQSGTVTHPQLNWHTGRHKHFWHCTQHRKWSDATDKYTREGQTKVLENSLTACLFSLCLKLTSSEYLLDGGCKTGWEKQNYFVSHQKEKGERSLSRHFIASDIKALWHIDFQILSPSHPPTLSTRQTCKPESAHTAASRNNCSENCLLQTVLPVFSGRTCCASNWEWIFKAPTPHRSVIKIIDVVWWLRHYVTNKTGIIPGFYFPEWNKWQCKFNSIFKVKWPFRLMCAFLQGWRIRDISCSKHLHTE